MRWAGYVARVPDSGKAFKVLVENPGGEDLVARGAMVLKLM
jgi:hypothetical protein